MGAFVRRVGVFATIAAIAVVALPATVSADCTPACGDEVEQGLEALGVVLLAVVLTVFVTVMIVGGRIVRRDRRSTD
jgi:hypothetical protein